MDVIGNNISNVNTVGYKTSRVIFQDIFSQNVAAGARNNLDVGIGGTNPMQIGLGIKLASVDVLHTPSAFQRTDNATDMMIGGEGFFVVEGPDGFFYTRAGNFKIDDAGYLVTVDGFFVMGYGYQNPLTDVEVHGEILRDAEGNPLLDAEGDVRYRYFVQLSNTAELRLGSTPGDLQRINVKVATAGRTIRGDAPPATHPAAKIPDFVELLNFSVAKDGSVEMLSNNRKVTIAKIGVAMFSNPGGLDKAGNSLYSESSSSGTPQVNLPYENGAGTVEGGGLEMSNVDLASEFTDMIVTQRGFQANSRIITVSDTMLEELVNLKR
jgi:flagellar hook protein FlgE